MTETRNTAERRAYPRITVCNGTVTLVDDHNVIMGRLFDISLGGAGISYLGDSNNELTGSELHMNLLTHQPRLYLEKIPCLIVFDDINAIDQDGRPLRRCGIRFQSLSERQQAQLVTLIHRQQHRYDPGREELEKQLIKSEEKYRTILESIAEGYFEVDIAGNFTFFNSSMLAMIGYTAGELMGLNYRNFMSPETAGRVFREYNQAYRSGILPSPFDWELIKKNGSTIFVETSLSFIRDSRDRTIGFRGIARDVSIRKQHEQELLYLASHDQLTGLYNRGALFEKLRETIAYARRFEKKFALMFLDLDNFKTVNDRFGHAAGDGVLKETAGRLIAMLRETDHICRHGGDEFTIILNNADTIDPVLVAQKIIDVIGAPYHIAGQTVDFVTASIGICIYPDDGIDVDTLIGRADKAMYRAKEKKNHYTCYNQGNYTRRYHLVSA